MRWHSKVNQQIERILLNQKYIIDLINAKLANVPDDKFSIEFKKYFPLKDKESLDVIESKLLNDVFKSNLVFINYLDTLINFNFQNK